MQNNQTYKNRALASLDGKWTNGVVAALITFLLTGIVGNAITFPFMDSPAAGTSVQALYTLVCLPLSWGFTVYFLNLIRNRDINYERLFDGYKDFVRIFLAEFLIAICVFFGCLLLIVPGVILGLMFSMTDFVLKDNPEMSATDAMKESTRLTNGHKMEIFWLVLSFIGWALLSLLTFGLGFLALAPYYESTLAHYYEDLKQEMPAA